VQTYFIASSSSVKVGKTLKSPLERLRQFQTAHPEKLRLLAALDGDCEKELHLRFAKHRQQGEWFSLDSEILQFLENQPPPVPPPPIFSESFQSCLNRADRIIVTVAVSHPNVKASGFSESDDHPLDRAHVATAFAFLAQCAKSKNLEGGSYGLKHAAETWGGFNAFSGYISNGALIAAAICLGFMVKWHALGLNAGINVSTKSVRALIDKVRELNPSCTAAY
jgi:hypothetical protein